MDGPERKQGCHVCVAFLGAIDTPARHLAEGGVGCHRALTGRASTGVCAPASAAGATSSSTRPSAATLFATPRPNDSGTGQSPVPDAGALKRSDWAACAEDSAVRKTDLPYAAGRTRKIRISTPGLPVLRCRERVRRTGPSTALRASGWSATGSRCQPPTRQHRAPAARRRP